MKPSTRIILPAVALLILAAVAVKILVHPQQQSDPISVSTQAPAPATESRVVTLPPRVPQASPVVPVASDQSVPIENSAALKTQIVPAAKKPSGSGKKVIQDSIAREALAMVGTDPAAEEYWFAAINNPSLSQSERQDLVDDLNEEGLPDPKHPTQDDLPILFARIELLEEAMFWFDGDVYDWKEPHDDLARMIRVADGSDEKID
jgi:hypothetical protein